MGTTLSNCFVNTDALPHNAFGWIQILFLGLTYGYILTQGADLITQGSELLLLIPSLAGLVGSVVLPVLGAIPDSAMVLFSGLGRDAQKQVSVGMGALAGSTIMLLTVPWFLSIWAGRVDLDEHGNANYTRPADWPEGRKWKKMSDPGKIRDTGVNVGHLIQYMACVGAITMIPYFVMQIPAIYAGCLTVDEEGLCEADRPIQSAAAITGSILCVCMFCFYLWDQMRISQNNIVAQDKKERLQRMAINSGMMTLKGLFGAQLHSIVRTIHAESGKQLTEGTNLLDKSETSQRVEEEFRMVLKEHFRRFDLDGDGGISVSELQLVLKDLGQEATPEELNDLMQEMDTDNNGQIDFDEFVVAMQRYVANELTGQMVSSPKPLATGGEEEEDDDGDDVPEDLLQLPPEVQQQRIRKRSYLLMAMGSLLVLFFSDPMVDLLSEVGTRLNVSSFYVAFIFGPLVSNGSELISAYVYASKKSEKSITISFATLLGASCMNNTLCLGIFLGLVYFKDLIWVFSAEITSIIVVEIIMYIICLVCGRVFRSKILFFIALLFPFSICLVSFLESLGLN